MTDLNRRDDFNPETCMTRARCINGLTEGSVVHANRESQDHAGHGEEKINWLRNSRPLLFLGHCVNSHDNEISPTGKGTQI